MSRPSPSSKTFRFESIVQFHKILITGGAGFVGANLAVMLKQAVPDIQVTAVDNLARRGSELNLPRLAEHSVAFVHGDIRCPDDIRAWPDFDLLIDCAAEPSVHAGTSGSPLPVLDNNLVGTIHCLEAARRAGAALMFLSTSRVYPIAPLNALPFAETETRFQWQADKSIAGFSERGIAESFSLQGARSFYGASKLAAELLLGEYVFGCQMPAVINRCGVLTGPWQMGKVDQGVVTLWVARHEFDKPLKYIGYGGTGKQVRDVLHVADLFDLLIKQIETPQAWQGNVYNIGGGSDVSLSLLELTEHCRQITGNTIDISSQSETNPVDVRIYLSDTTAARKDFDWQPRRGVEQIVADIHRWIVDQREAVEPILG